ncbi:MAG TPA: LacI family DNA-binding transcriptional regulator [Anaerolineaceae bacterium]
MKVTIRDVAKKLNVSIATVSRALDGYPDISDEMRRQVIQTAEELGYVPNQAARHLRRRRTDAIGYILPAPEPRFGDPFFSEFIAGLGDESARQNLDLLVSTAPPGSPEEEGRYTRWIHGMKVDGFILNRLKQQDWRISRLTAEKIPFATLECNQDAAKYPNLTVESVESVSRLIQYLAGKGHQRIAYIGAHDDLVIQVDRFAGYQLGLKQAGIPFDPNLIFPGNLTPQGGFAAAHHLLSLPNPPTAIFCINDLTAFGVLRAAQERGIQVGKSLAVAGFDGLAESETSQPPLTTLNQPVYDIACKIVRMLVRLISGEHPPSETIIPELILRDSTG